MNTPLKQWTTGISGKHWEGRWVATDGSNVTGKGTYHRPWATLAHACSQATPGEVIVLKAGTFNIPAQVNVPVGVSIRGQGDATILTTSSALSPMLMFSSNAEGTNGNQSVSHLKMDGALTAVTLIYVNARSNVSIHNCTFANALTYGITFRGKVDGTAGAPTTYATGNRFYNNTVTNCSRYTGGNGYGNIEISGQAGLQIYNNTITQPDRGGTEHGYGIKAVNNHGYNHGLKIFNNTITVPVYENAGFEFAIELWSSRGGIEIYNNTISGGVDLGGYDTNDSHGYGFAAKIYGNDIGRTTTQPVIGRGVIIESGGTAGISGGVYVYNNDFHHISNPIELGVGNSAGMTYSDIYFHHNLFREIRQSVAGYNGYVMQVLRVGGRTATFNNVRFLNNTIYNLAAGNLAASFWCGTSGHTWSNTIIRNNIFVNSYSTVKIENCTVTNINVDNNNWFGCNQNIVYDNCTVTGNTAANNITSNPLFVSTSNLRLQTGSPCINAGIDVGLTTDRAGVSVGNPPEIGAYEYQP